jgi:hypothetical protein
MGKIKLACDLDGVLYNFHDALYTFCQYELGYEGTYEKFWLDYMQNISKDKCDYLIGLPMPYETSIPSKQITEFLDFAEKNANEIYYITHRPLELERVTRRYLKRNNFPYPENVFISGDKATICRYVGATHFIDDFVKHVKAVSGIAESYLMAKPWNREFQSEFNTVHNLKEFQERIFQ